MKGSRNSLTSLRIFLVAARTLNFSMTGELMHLTQSAVSKHVAALEKHLGTPLFERTSNGLKLSHAGMRYRDYIQQAIRLIDEADILVSNPSSRIALNIAVSPSFAQSCLIPALKDFFSSHPEVKVNIRPRLPKEDRSTERFDAEIQLNTGHARGMSATYLCGREMALVVAPELIADSPPRLPEDLDHMVLLKRAQPGYGWEEWKSAMAPGWASPSSSSPEYEGFSILLPAVLNGLGAAIFPLCLVKDHLQSGRLVRPFGESVSGRYGYYLLEPRPQSPNPYIAALCNWIREYSKSLNTAPEQR